MRLITWNINSVRARLGIVEQLINEYEPDILCLQETKVQDHMFPRKFFEDLGMPHMAIHGQKSHHGVATLSKIPFESEDKINWCDMGDARHISIKLNSGQRIHNFYVPAGGDVPDPEENDKFAHKLKFVDEMTEWSKTIDEPSILVGDLNIAPYEDDVWSHKQLLKVVSHTPIETDAMKTLMAAHDWVDVMREFVPIPERLYSWWSYRARDWSASNKGRRLDHVWVSPSLKSAATSMEVLRDARGWEKPSDHAPVMVDLDI
jgi:exodeoxyribonuclease-3